MRASVLEFRLGENSFCFDTGNVAYVFELEEYEPVAGMHESVVGVAKHNDDVLLLIDTDVLYRGTGAKKSDQKSVVIVFMDKEQNRYGLLVDEILEIEEIESVRPTVDLNSEDMVVNHYKDEKQESIVSEILPIPLFKKYHIPSIVPKKRSSQERNEEQRYAGRRERSYLLFEMDNRRFGVEAERVLEVLALEKDFFEMDSDGGFHRGAVTVRDEVITLISQQPLSSCKEIVVVESGKKKFGIGVESVEDIAFFITEKIEFFNSLDTPVAGLYSLENQVVAIVSVDFYASTLAVSGKRIEKSSKNRVEHKRKRDFLIFHVGTRRFAIDMHYVRQVVELASLSKTRAGSVVSSEMVEFLATWNHEAVEVLRLDDLLGEVKNREESEVIFIEVDGSVVAFIVEDIDDIVYLDEESVAAATEADGIISGAILYEEDVIATINPAYIAKSG